MVLEELNKRKDNVIKRVLERDRQLTLEAIERIAKYFEEHEAELCHSNIVCPEIIMAEEKRPLVRQKIPLVLAAMCSEGIVKLDEEKTLECGIPHYRIK